ncbi:MAG: hypothetical protein IT303_20340 [Dehalococcoidia bacterium]|nr:hypothetical protein [Dehalococcoidia bacterium]
MLTENRTIIRWAASLGVMLLVGLIGMLGTQPTGSDAASIRILLPVSQDTGPWRSINGYFVGEHAIGGANEFGLDLVPVNGSPAGLVVHAPIAGKVQRLDDECRMYDSVEPEPDPGGDLIHIRSDARKPNPRGGQPLYLWYQICHVDATIADAATVEVGEPLGTVFDGTVDHLHVSLFWGDAIARRLTSDGKSARESQAFSGGYALEGVNFDWPIGDNTKKQPVYHCPNPDKTGDKSCAIPTSMKPGSTLLAPLSGDQYSGTVQLQYSSPLWADGYRVSIGTSRGSADLFGVGLLPQPKSGPQTLTINQFQPPPGTRIMWVRIETFSQDVGKWFANDTSIQLRVKTGSRTALKVPAAPSDVYWAEDGFFGPRLVWFDEATDETSYRVFDVRCYLTSFLFDSGWSCEAPSHFSAFPANTMFAVASQLPPADVVGIPEERVCYGVAAVNAAGMSRIVLQEGCYFASFE